MDTVFIGIFVALGIAVLLRGLFTSRSQPQIIYVRTESPAPQPEGWGCLPFIILGVILIVFLL